MEQRLGALEDLELTRAFWAGKTVLVTGHTGFKGSWLALWLSSLGADVIGYGHAPPTEPSLFELARVGELVRTQEGDVRDFAALRGTVERHRPDVVFHLAAQPLVRRSFADPLGTYETNVMGTVHLLEAVRGVGGVRVVVNVTTDKVYENREWEWGYREHEPKGGYDPYASSKACSELVTDAYRASFFGGGAGAGPGTAVASARAGNVIGGGDWADDRLVPDFIRCALDGRPLLVRNPDAIRPWQHVLNPLSGYGLLAEHLWADPGLGQGWNFGPEDRDAQPVRFLADRLCEHWGEGLRWEQDGAPQPHEATYLKLDSSAAAMRLGWRPRWGLDEGLRRTVEWFRAYRDGADLRALCLAQVEAFAD